MIIKSRFFQIGYRQNLYFLIKKQSSEEDYLVKSIYWANLSITRAPKREEINSPTATVIQVSKNGVWRTREISAAIVTINIA